MAVEEAIPRDVGSRYDGCHDWPKATSLFSPVKLLNLTRILSKGHHRKAHHRNNLHGVWRGPPSSPTLIYED
ncbi:unnamed protein product [Dovyalis caffra]|uniref:Uncharacterized protein n=1 Tax=Dovyalis caffra TaxID=77055 RepID=A0AAV1S042_9ROSI|nr:unnamed protein product [Dovyalis caffra]